MEEIITAISTVLEDLNVKIPATKVQTQEISELNRLFRTLKSHLSSENIETGNKILGQHALEILHKYLTELDTNLKDWKNDLKKVDQVKLLSLLSKLKVIIDHLEYVFQLPHDDIDILPEDHPRTINLKNATTTILISDKEELLAVAKGFFDRVKLLKAVVYKILKYKKSYWRNFLTGYLIFYFIFNPKKIERYAEMFGHVPGVEKNVVLWDIPETDLMRKILPIALPSIKVNKMIFIPRLAPHVLDTKANVPKSDSNLHYSEILLQEPILSGSQHSFHQDPDKRRIPVRILSPQLIKKLVTKGDSCSPSNEVYKKYDKIIIHVHGGAYVAMSSYSHQTYTRLWANELDVPVFSIDYRKAPENKYPSSLEDVWQVYIWILKYLNKHLGITPNKIILAGDSAGGNLITGVTLRAISLGYRIPDGLMLIYPAMSMEIRYPSKSLFLSLENVILSHNLFFVIRDSYITPESSVQDYLISPVFAPYELLEKFPRSEIMITLEDPLASDTIRFAEKLLRAAGNVHVTEYPYIFHGAINFGNQQNIPLYMKFVDDSIELLRKLLT
jgi:hormone-sensitive lipase